MKISIFRKAGFTLVEIMIVVAIIGLLATIAIPNFLKARTTAQTNACINNLRQIDGAIQTWALQSNQGPNAAVTAASIAPYLGRGTAGALINTDIKCPAGGTYTLATVADKPTCSQASLGHVLP